MRRRGMLALPLLLAGCGLSERPYEERRQWPLLVPRPVSLPPLKGGKVLEVRALREGPGMTVRGLQSLQADGSLRVAFYEDWTVPPAQGVEDALREWLAASGKFAAVVAPGSRVAADFYLEGELTALLTVPAAGVARAALSVVVVDAHGVTPRAVLQRRVTAEAPLGGATPEAAMRAQVAALAVAFSEIEGVMPR
jgi:cholesterol transport system auxiliary component